MNPGGPPTNLDGSPMYPGGPPMFLGGPPMFSQMRAMNPAAQNAFYTFCQAAGWDPNNAYSWNREERYRPIMGTPDLATLGTHGSGIDPAADFPINTDDYDISNMEPTTDLALSSPPEVATGSRAQGKGKAKEKPAHVGAKRYTLEETIVVAKCYVDVSEDSIFANQQRVNKFWARITKKYNQLKPEWA